MAQKKPAAIEKEIIDNIQNDPAFTDPSKIIVNVKSGGNIFKKTVIVEMSGSVPALSQKEKIERYVENKYGNLVVIESTLTVG